ncbi:unnamed protein product [Ixodes hexagonus]
MPVATKLQSLYLATSVEELDKKFSTRELPSQNIRMVCKSIRTVLQKADLDRDMGDEERAYVLYVRYFTMVQLVRKHRDYKKDTAKYDEAVMIKQCPRVMETMEKLKESLIKRYALLKEVKAAKAKEQKEAEEAYAEQQRGRTPVAKDDPDLSKSDKTNGDPGVAASPVPSAGVVKPAKTCISSFELYDLLLDNALNLLILDCRERDDFFESHLKHSHCINIPEEVLSPGITGEELSAAVPDESRSLFGRRDLVDFVILIDWRSKEVPSVPTVPLRVLKDAIWKWCTTKHLRSEPMVLIGGYEDWLLRYPMHTTYAHPRIPTPPSSPRPPDLTIGQSCVIDFPDLDRDFGQKPQNPEQNAASTNHSESLGSGNGAWQPMPSVDRSKKPSVPNGPTVPNNMLHKVANGVSINQHDSLLDAARINTPQVDRASKPGPTGPFGRDVDESEVRPASQKDARRTSVSSGDDEVPSRASTLGQELLELTKDVISEKVIAALRSAGLASPHHAPRARSTLLRVNLGKIAVSRKDRSKSKLKMEHPFLSQQLQEKDRELERIVRLQEEQKKAEKELKRMREERKQKEQKEREEAEKRKGAVAPKTPSASARTRTQASTANEIGQDHGGQGESSALKHMSPTAWNSSGLSRSRSFPNLSTAAEEEEQQSAKRQLDTSATPGFDRTLKPSQSVETSSASLNRQSRVRSNDGPNMRVRGISPSFGREVKRLAGLKNLGNTCYMNATLQCLANTVPLAMHFISGNYHADINRESRRGTGGEAANEFKNLVTQMYYNDKSVAPKSFKASSE